MTVDRVATYLAGLTVTVPRYIPTFAQACREQVRDPKLFEECIFTRTFVAFGPERRCKLHTLEDIEELRKMPTLDGFITISEERYKKIRSKEYDLDDRGVLDIQEPFSQSGTDILWDLIAEGEAENLATYMCSKFNEEQRTSGKNVPLVWIKRQGPPTTPYLSPLRVGTRNYYIAVGEDRIDRRSSDRDTFTFLQLPYVNRGV